MSDKATLKAFFETGDVPTEVQYADLIDSNINTDDTADQVVVSQVTSIGGFGKSAAFTEAIKADAQGYFPDYTQTGVLNFTKDASVVDNQGYGNGIHGIITASGDAWNFTSDFDVIGDIDPPIAGEKYALTAIWRGLKFTAVYKQIGISSGAFENTKSGSFTLATDDYVTTTNRATELEFSNGATDLPFSISFLMKMNNTGTTTKIIVLGESGDEIYTIFQIDDTHGSLPNRIRFALYDVFTSDFIYIQTAGAVSRGAWHRITVTYDGSGLNGTEIYVDNVLDAAPTRTTGGTYSAMGAGSATTRFRMGSDFDAAPTDGLLDEVSVWSKALSGAEETELTSIAANLEDHSAYANLELWPRFEDDVVDSSTNAIQLTNNDVTFSADVAT